MNGRYIFVTLIVACLSHLTSSIRDDSTWHERNRHETGHLDEDNSPSSSGKRSGVRIFHSLEEFLSAEHSPKENDENGEDDSHSPDIRSSSHERRNSQRNDKKVIASKKQSLTNWEEDDDDTDGQVEGTTTPISASKKNVFVYVPFRPSKSPNYASSKILQSTTSVPSLRKIFATSQRETTNLPIRLSKTPDGEGSPFQRNWQPVKDEKKKVFDITRWNASTSLKASQSKTYFVQTSLHPSNIDSRSAHVLDESVSRTLHLTRPSSHQVVHQQQIQLPQKDNRFEEQRTIHQTQHVQDSLPHQVNYVQHQPRPVHLNVIQGPPQSPPVQVNFVQQETPRPVVVVNEPRVDVVKVHSPPRVYVQAPRPIIVRSPPIVRAPVLVQAPPIVHHPPAHVVHVPPPIVRAHPVVVSHPPIHQPPLLVHSPPPCGPVAVHAPLPPLLVRAPPAIVHQPIVHHPVVPVVHAPPPPTTFYAAPVPQRTRTVYHSVQYLPEQTHVYTTTQFSPATKTTIYETDHVGAYSDNKVVVAAPPRLHHAEKEPSATVYSFPPLPSILGTRVLTVPIKLAGRLIRERRVKVKGGKKKKKRIFIFGDGKRKSQKSR